MTDEAKTRIRTDLIQPIRTKPYICEYARNQAWYVSRQGKGPISWRLTAVDVWAGAPRESLGILPDPKHRPPSPCA